MTSEHRRLCARLFSPVVADGQPDRYGVQPGGKLPSRVEAVDVPESFEERFLGDIFNILICLGFVTEKMAQPSVVAVDQFFESTRQTLNRPSSDLLV